MAFLSAPRNTIPGNGRPRTLSREATEMSWTERRVTGPS